MRVRMAWVTGCLGLAMAGVVPAADEYRLGLESTERAAGVPKGRVESFEFEASRVFPGTHRHGWIYIPAQYQGREPAAVMVFQDGHAYVGETGLMRVPIVLDNLIAKGAMPVTIGVFVNPGHRGGGGPDGSGWGNRNNRSVEYDSLGDAYARFLIEELLPFVERTFEVRLSDDPARNAVAGMSSGGICAWTVAWERPDRFGKVLSHIGSFVNIRGGHVYPALIRKTGRKPIRVFLQDGSNDLNNAHGNWPLANLEMASALAFAGYDHRFVYGDGAHNGRHGGAILPESLRWLWREEPGAGVGLEAVLPDGGIREGWELVGEGYAFTDAAASDADGNFHFSDLPRGDVYRVPAAGGTPRLWLENGPKISGMKFGADGWLYACVQATGTNETRRIVAIEPGSKRVETMATGVQPNDLVVTRSGHVFFTDTAAGQIQRVPTSAREMSRPPTVAGGIARPNGIALSSDESELWVSEHGGRHVWRFALNPDGSLGGGERRAVLAVPNGGADSGGDGAATDGEGRVWVTSHLGIQVFDGEGRSLGVVSRPQDKGSVSVAFGGTGHRMLYVCSSDRVYRRMTRTLGR
ncbi:MAG: SMP-30/gluconolactonase/LRE family protein [Verrucomicrobiae bacterium]|nr:SMP-30/gluconolactonase/LRE family protein [Verrucomicrobiae bacterium]